jgi:hypothetical protein
VAVDWVGDALVGTGAVPDTKITKARVDSRGRKAAFEFKAIGKAEGFRCELVRGRQKARFEPCRSPKSYRHLEPGRYTFRVRAVGRRGRDPTPATSGFRIRA